MLLIMDCTHVYCGSEAKNIALQQEFLVRIQDVMTDLQRRALKLSNTHPYSVGSMSTDVLCVNIFQRLLRIMQETKLIDRLFIEGKP